MSASSNRVEIQELLVHADWVRAVAFELVGNVSEVDDVVQATWTAAVERPPKERGNLRAWLRQVIRNQARMLGRGEARRGQRERAAARPEAQASTDELVERAALERELIGHVLSLDEPFREVVLKRFFEDLTPPKIADQLNLPLKTVHSRLARAFEKLRTRMDAEYGHQRNWCMALIPLFAGREWITTGSGWSLTATGGFALSTNAKLGLAGLVLLASGFGAWQWLANDPSHAAPPAEETELAQPSNDTKLPPDTSQESVPAERTAVAQLETPKEPQPATAEPQTVTVKARLVSTTGDALGGLPVTSNQSGEQLAVTEPDGTFEVQAPPASDLFWKVSSELCLQVLHPEWVTLRQSCIKTTNYDFEHIVVAAPSIELAGRIVDTDSVPIVDAKVDLGFQAKSFYGHPYALDKTSQVIFSAESDESGRFQFEHFPDARGVSLSISAPGYQKGAFVLEEQQAPYEFTLKREEELDATFLTGIVLDQQGQLVSGANVQLAHSLTQSKADGSFQIPLVPVAATTPLCASVRGKLPALIPNFGALLAVQAGQPEPVELVLGGEPLEIKGRIVDAKGAACAKWNVLVLDETAVTQYSFPIQSAEALARKKTSKVRTDKNGEFVITGLYPRDYRLMAFQSKSLFRTEATVPAGSEGITLRADCKLRGHLEGTVTDRRGKPVAGVRVALSLYTYKTNSGSTSAIGDHRVTDANGHFYFESVPAEHIYLNYNGERVIPNSVQITEDVQVHTVDIEAMRRCHFRVDLAGRDGINSAQLLDAEGNSLQINRFEANGMSAFPYIALIKGQSETLSVSEGASAIVLRKEGVEVERHAVTLDPESVTVLSY